MSKIKVVHYINNFFANIGGEEKADVPPEIREGKVGPGLALEAALGEGYEIVATAICGDSYFGENMEDAKATLVDMISGYEPDLFVAGPAFNAGRYGTACGSIAKEIEEKLEIPVVTGMYPENPGVDMYKLDLHIIETSISAAGMRKAMGKIANIAKKLVNKEEILSPVEEGYIERGIRVNYFNEERGSKRAVEMLVKKMKKEAFTTEYPMPVFDRVDPMPAIKDLSKVKVAVVTSGGLVPQGNPDRIESSSATKYGIYSIAGMDSMDKKDFMTIHGGYDRAFITEDPNLCIPLDVLREYEKEGVIGELADYYVATTGTGTSVGNAKGFGESFSKKLVEDGIGAVLLTST
ncbi:glycine reductase [Dethiosulfatibacter aminovorans DSM 17477]|uniref:Glycine reductase n=3 Tax=Dethiosulfatibacter TaxID=448125 RepID=A0A1M6LPX5_9FIRM|nr:glycine reductase [Dethiosulfatibacter aminovorans DSM 17477]